MAGVGSSSYKGNDNILFCFHCKSKTTTIINGWQLRSGGLALLCQNCGPLRWDFSSGYTGHVMTFEVGAVLEDANWQAPVNCFDENDKEKNIPILGSAVRGGSLGSYDVGSAT
ncbi:hypothetical protein JHK87_052345 [Glycine soja]|nr:hypothetical protein JHK87_052345 [Glycine soja]